MGKFYNCYRLLSQIFSPLIKLYFYFRCFRGKDEKENVKNHFGYPTIARPEGKLIWIHAASIGEANSAMSYIKHFKENHPDTNVLLTTITLTSANMFREKIKEISGCYHQFVVADVPGWINRFLDYWQPSMVMFLESEIWPNLVNEIHRRNIPLYLVNARLSDKSFENWKRVEGFMHNILSMFNKILAQSRSDTEKFQYFGDDNVVQIDSLKYANSILPYDSGVLDTFRSFCTGRQIFVAISTHEGEEEFILRAHKLINKEIPITTIIIPRHTQRVSKIIELCSMLHLSCSVKSSAVKGHLIKSDIFIVDTYGEVGTFCRLAQITFVGGSLVNLGGHNILEPAALGKIVLHGPYMSNFSEIVENLYNLNAAYEVKNTEDIVRICLQLLKQPELLKKMSETLPDKVQNKSLEQIDKWVQ